MKRPILYHYRIDVPESPGICTSVVGGPLKPSKKPGWVFVTTPNGDPSMEVPKAYIHPISQEDYRKLIESEIQYQRALKTRHQN